MRPHIIRCLSVTLALAAAGSHGAVRVLACETEWAALALAIGGSHVDVTSATSAAQDPHFIQARPSLIARARRADLLVCTGAGLEQGWLPVLLRKSGNRKIQPGAAGYFMAAQQVQLLGKPTVVDRAAGDVHPMGNPHVHLNPRRLLAIGGRLRDRLIQLAPGAAAELSANYGQLVADLDALFTGMSGPVSGLAGESIVVHHTTWLYLAEWLGLEHVATIEPKPGLPPTSSHLAALVSRLGDEPVAFIIRANYQNPRAADWLSSRTGTPVRVLQYSPADWAAEGSLVTWYREILGTLVPTR